MNTIKAAIVGARGHVGFELIKMIDQHPHAELVAAYSRAYHGQFVCEKVTGFSNESLQYKSDYLQDMQEQDFDVVFLALPNSIAAAHKEMWEELGQTTSIIDLSADFRFDDQWCYGQPETREKDIEKHSLIANPGCYATALQLGVFPMLDCLDGPVHAFGVSGFSGAGSTPCDRNNAEKLKDNLMAYHMIDHIHEHEVSHVLKTDVRFVPHVAAFFRGIQMTINVPLQENLSENEVMEKFNHHYQQHDLIEVIKDVPEIRHVRDTHGVIIGGFTVKDKRLVLCVVIDNLLKGAATQAIQNMNLTLKERFPLSMNTGIECKTKGALS